MQRPVRNKQQLFGRVTMTILQSSVQQRHDVYLHCLLSQYQRLVDKHVIRQ